VDDPNNPDETILDHLWMHARTCPDCLAYRFLSDGGESDSVTYGQLGRRVRRLAKWLLEQTSIGARALLLYPPGLEFIEVFLACLAAGVIAIPAYPPRRNRKAERLQTIIEDARPAIILTTRQVLPTIAASELCSGSTCSLVVSDAVKEQADADFQLPRVDRSTVAFLQYTSGSTSTPRGVVVTHGNLAFNARQVEVSFHHTHDSVMVSWLPVFHDMGLVGGVIQPLFVGFPSILLSPMTFLREPVRWLQAITRYRGTTTGAPNFAYDHCVRLIAEEQKVDLDLSSLKVAYNGSEPVRAETLDRFAAAFQCCGFRREAFFPCYGLAESTLFVAGGPPDRPPPLLHVDGASLEQDRLAVAPDGAAETRMIVGCGRIAEGTTARIVHPESHSECAPGSIGEIWLSSPSVAAGYWGRMDLTKEAFRAVMNGDTARTYLRTGDLGFIHQGELFITGRLKDVIIIRGRKIYPQDIETVVEREASFVPANGSAAFSVEVNGEENLGLVFEGDRGLLSKSRGSPEEIESLVASIQASVTRQFDVRVLRVVIVKPGTLPRTSSGKVMRRACCEGVRNGTLDEIYRWQIDRPTRGFGDPAASEIQWRREA
jgi:acyl-CoA synthetase (AMP-forming)/AMP-acid ligase II